VWLVDAGKRELWATVRRNKATPKEQSGQLAKVSAE
jgi:hypothetical protein